MYEIKQYLLEDPIQNLEIDYCWIFQFYFYENLFGPKMESEIMKHKILTKNTIQVPLKNYFHQIKT